MRGSENGVVIGIKEYQKIYEMLDKVSPVPYDCGAGCGAVCCRDDSFDKDSEPYIYLLPGEKEYLAWQDRKNKGVPVGDAIQKELIELRDELGLDNYHFPFE